MTVIAGIPMSSTSSTINRLCPIQDNAASTPATTLQRIALPNGDTLANLIRNTEHTQAATGMSQLACIATSNDASTSHRYRRRPGPAGTEPRWPVAASVAASPCRRDVGVVTPAR